MWFAATSRSAAVLGLSFEGPSIERYPALPYPYGESSALGKLPSRGRGYLPTSGPVAQVVRAHA